MSGITQSQAEEQLSIWLEASTAVASGQSYSMGSRSLSRADAGEIRENIDYWDKKCKDIAMSAGDTRTGVRLWGGTPT